MKIEELKPEGLKRHYKVHISPEEIAEKVDGVLKKLSKDVQMPGFRKGKVPMKMLRARYEGRALQEAAGDIVNSTSQKILDERKIRVAGRPNISLTKFDQTVPSIEYEMKFEELPELPDVDFKKLKVEKLTSEINEKDIDAFIKDRFKDTPVYKEAAKTKKAKMGDAVKAKATFFENGKEMKNESRETRFTLDENREDDRFVKALVGVKQGDDVTIDMSDMAKHKPKEKSDLKIECKVEVLAVLERQDTKFDDNLAKELNFKNFDELKAESQKQLEKEVTDMGKSYMKRDLLDRLDEMYDIEVPEGMLDAEFKTIWRQVEAESKKEGGDAKKLEASKDEYKQIAERRVKLGLLLAEIGNKEKLAVSDREVNERLGMMAYQSGMDQKSFMSFIKNNPHIIDNVRAQSFEEKVVDWLLEKVKAEEKKVAYKDFNKLYDDKLESEMPVKGKKKAAPKKKAASETKKTSEKKDTKKAAAPKEKSTTKKTAAAKEKK